MAQRHVLAQSKMEHKLTAPEVTRDVLDRLSPRPQFWIVASVLGILFAAGAIAFVIRLFSAGLDHRASWGYLAMALAYLLATVQPAPLVAIGLTFTKAAWRWPLVRISQLFAVAGIMSLLVYLPLVATLPATAGRRTIWFDWPYAPWLYDTIAMLAAVALGLAILYLSAVPDFAAARDHLPKSRRNLYARLALNWQGTPRQWTMLRVGSALLGAFYMMLIVLVHLLIPLDFAMTLVPGWISSVFPAISLIGGLQASLAATIVAMYLWRRWGGLERYIHVDHFREPSKILLALCLLWFYPRWADFLTRWYGRTPREQILLAFLEFGPYFVPWVLAMTLAFVVPLFTLIQYRIRNSILGPTLVSLSVLTGNFFEGIRFYVGAFSVEETAAHQLERVPLTQLPDVLDIFMVLGALAGAALMYLAATKIVPPLAIWELKQELLLRVHRPFLRGEYTVLGKPH